MNQEWIYQRYASAYWKAYKSDGKVVDAGVTRGDGGFYFTRYRPVRQLPIGPFPTIEAAILAYEVSKARASS